ncbi:acyl-CoA dehydrogenase (plasmid) [Deinococcus metallilatus]|uniref:Acyl-CoA dehydrogenase n=2 Tax=Deinococcus metallilatus TaxID=1211322 RepID=A0AAJ5K197_9DEIO|nr:acyl-CoA dehydrogenase [Deinococcus metallilatus]MBB5297288.1 butyryl-CoA dehydrogenase [Deinococcus metallilatus]QBY06966.1 acyl-CoA dehydrogenase [Deinococcus metallilatus]TLK31913.1 acyl-CoA dehydrogenase [Deinococcus metallilatus]GMA17148.1 acyl-CoA dehydrogenase [Deinococcus metallilatus]
MAPFLSRRDLQFQLYEVLDTASLPQRPRFAEHSREVYDDVLNLAYNVADKYFANHAREADLNEPHVVDGKVKLVPAAAEAMKAFREAGFFSAHHDEELGGLQLPHVVTQAAQAHFKAANIGTSSYPFLTIGNANLQRAFASPEQQQKYMLPLLEGRWFGTMALSEPHAGSGLADITTTATPREDGTYSITGTKMWISAGEHELSENIVHLVLARIKGAPAGIRGISLFIVPRYRVNEDGSLGESNNVVLAGLNHKMGYRGTTNTLLNFGEGGETIGELIGEPGRGLQYMFHMMNGARIGVGMGAVMLGYAGYLASLEYARERRQGRHASNKDAASEPVRIIEHADVRRLLLRQKSIVEGGLALGLYAAHLEDEIETGPEEGREDNALLLDLLTPIVKSWPSKYSQEALSDAIQVMGGAGYTRDAPVEMYYRDNRLNPIHEGTEGIQGNDLLGRKVTQAGGRGLKVLLSRIQADLKASGGLEGLDEIRSALEQAVAQSSAALQSILTKAPDLGPDLFLANANSALEMLGHTVIGWMWLRQAIAAARALPEARGDDADFYRGKLQAARFFATHELPKVKAHAELLASADRTTFEMQDAWF